jgi:hypothetical protein
VIKREGDGWRLPLEQRIVSRCIVDHAFALELLEAETFVVRIEGAFSLTQGERTFQLSPSDPQSLGPALALFGRVIRMAHASDDGELQIVFADGQCLSVKSDPRYEAWELVGPGGMRAVSAPSGDIVVWQNNKETR